MPSHASAGSLNIDPSNERLLIRRSKNIRHFVDAFYILPVIGDFTDIDNKSSIHALGDIHDSGVVHAFGVVHNSNTCLPSAYSVSIFCL